jgi:hypothetical protein
MNHYFTTELGRMRTEEGIARADRYRLAQLARRSTSSGNRSRLSWSRATVYRRALAAVGVSALMLIGSSAVAQARPIGPGPTGDGVATDITASKHHPQVKGGNPGQPNRAEHAYDASATEDPNAYALQLRADYYERLLGEVPNDAVAEAALQLRAEYYQERLTEASDAIAHVRALNEPSTGGVSDPVAQLRAMNEPFSTTQAPGLEASNRPEQDFPLAQSIALIVGVLVLGAGALMVLTRREQSPKTV